MPSTRAENTKRATIKQVCRYGHDTQVVGRSKSGGCIACAKVHARARYRGITFEQALRTYPDYKG